MSILNRLQPHPHLELKTTEMCDSLKIHMVDKKKTKLKLLFLYGNVNQGMTN